MSLLKLEKLSVAYNKKKILSDVNLAIDRGEIVGLIGVNGSGKTTLLKAICNSVLYSGDCYIEENNIKELSAKALARLCSYIPQTTGISIDISVLDVVLMGANPFMGMLQNPDLKMIEKAKGFIDGVGLSGKADFNFMNLSEGQKQLCIMARSMMADTKLVLMDEPESALDFNMRHKMLGLIKKWIYSSDKGMLVTLHDINLALEFCDRLLILHEGNIAWNLDLKTESLQALEEKLGSIYHDVKLLEYKDASGNTKMIMVHDS